ncbi:hypothetical protein F5B20DRAFT_593269 [Whalleya microplaca]|nr:hypothetical protein F5B20DRAFT_593269 [Whalleya microplaca]
MDPGEDLAKLREQRNEQAAQTWATLIRSRPQKIVSHADRSKHHHSLPGQPMDPSTPPSFPFDCGEDCIVCFNGYFPSTRHVSDDYARQQTDRLRKQIQDDRQYLQTVVIQEADSIVALWKKLSQHKRKEILNSEVNLFETSLSGFMSLLQEPYNQDTRERTEQRIQQSPNGTWVEDYKHSWLLPYLDVEKLAESHIPLLALLYYRTTFPPQDWALFDMTQTVYADQEDVLPYIYNAHCIDLTDPNFGHLTPWDRLRAHRNEIVGFGRGLYLLAAQSNMMELLRRCVEALLRQIVARRAKAQHATSSPDTALAGGLLSQGPLTLLPLSSKQMSKWDELVQNGFSLGTGFLNSTYLNRPFSAPPTFNPTEVLETLTSLYQAEADKLYLMQTDPQYLQQMVRQLSSSMLLENIDKDYEFHIISLQIMRYVLDWQFWLMLLVKECENTIEYHRALSEDRSSLNQYRYDHAVAQLFLSCTRSLCLCIMNIKQAVPLQRRFQEGYAFATIDPTRPGYVIYSIPDWYHQDRLIWSLKSMCQDEFRRWSFDPVVYIQTFYRELETSKSQRQRITPELMKIVDNAAALDEIRTAIQCARGWNRCARKEYSWIPEVKENHRLVLEFRDMATVLDSHGCHLPYNELKAFCTEHEWPKGKIDMHWLQQVRASRDALDRLWAAYEHQLVQAMRTGGISKDYIARTKKILGARSSERYRREKEAEEEHVRICIEKENARLQSRKAKSSGKQPPHLTQGLTTTLDAVTKNLKKTVLAEASKKTPKKKTRGQPPAPAEPDPQPLPFATQEPTREEPEPKEEEARKIAVKPHHMVLLAQMFPVPGEPPASRTFRWQQFVDVVTHAGFEARQGNGSAVVFRHPEIGGTIVFHQPHPEPKIDPIMLSTMGKRLAKWFGWERDMFVVEEG